MTTCMSLDSHRIGGKSGFRHKYPRQKKEGFGWRNEKKALLQQFVRKNKRPLKTTDLCGKNGLVSSGAFRRYNIGIVDINRMIGTDEILAELAAEQEQKQEQKSN